MGLPSEISDLKTTEVAIRAAIALWHTMRFVSIRLFACNRERKVCKIEEDRSTTFVLTLQPNLQRYFPKPLFPGDRGPLENN